jgi:hypothetical protein
MIFCIVCVVLALFPHLKLRQPPRERSLIGGAC